MKKWEDYIEFEGIKYGLPNIVDNIHRYNNCMGHITREYEECSAKLCRNWEGVLVLMKFIICVVNVVYYLRKLKIMADFGEIKLY